MTARELDILNILFSNSESMTAAGIARQRSGLTQSTVVALLKKLLKFGYVEVTGKIHVGPVLCRVYRPTGEAKEAVTDYVLQIYDKMKGIVSVEELCQNLEVQKNNG